MRNSTSLLTLLLTGAFLAMACGLPFTVTFTNGQSEPSFQEPTPEQTIMEPTIDNTQPASVIVPFPEINIDRLYTTLTLITSFQPYSGWRSAGSQGEQEALDFLENEITQLEYLSDLGLSTERQQFHIPEATEFWQTGVDVTIGNEQYTIPANGLQGLDSDGFPNDINHNSVLVSGVPLIIRTQQELLSLDHAEVSGKLLWLDYELLDVNTYNQGDPNYNEDLITALDPAGIILTTIFSNTVGISHGTFALDLGFFAGTGIPVVQVTIEDMAAIGISGWEDLDQISNATISWDQDILTPGTSGNFIATIPGEDESQYVIISAHIDSAANPGALDDGSGSAILMEIASVLNENRIQPEYNLILAWFGSEEAGLYGSAHFVNTHTDILSQSIANLQIDCLTRPLDGVQARVQIAFWNGSWRNETLTPWAEYIRNAAMLEGIDTGSIIMNLASDNSNFQGFGVPNTDIILDGDDEMESIGGTWYGGHIHDPYDTVELARDVRQQFSDMATIALRAALLPEIIPPFSDEVATNARVVFFASHNESGYMTPVGLSGLGEALRANGYEMDIIPYGIPVVSSDLENADMVVVLPTFDFYDEDPPATTFDEVWSEDEIHIISEYVGQGGMLVITNSAFSLGYYNATEYRNEDLTDANALGTIFGFEYTPEWIRENWVEVSSNHQLMTDVTNLVWAHENAVPFQLESGEILVSSSGRNIIVLIPVGTRGGEILLLADLAILGTENSGLLNEEFVRNLLEYGLNR